MFEKLKPLVKKKSICFAGPTNMVVERCKIHKNILEDCFKTVNFMTTSKLLNEKIRYDLKGKTYFEIKQTKNSPIYQYDIIVIDEISMMSEKLFELIDYLCKKIRNNQLSFGGIQVIMSGDFYQLPPVCKDKNIVSESNFCFQSDLWDSTFDYSYIFEKNFRQSGDKKYFEMLQEIRVGEPSLETIVTLVECSKKKENQFI